MEGLSPGKPWEVAEAEGKTCSVGREGIYRAAVRVVGQTVELGFGSSLLISACSLTPYKILFPLAWISSLQSPSVLLDRQCLTMLTAMSKWWEKAGDTPGPASSRKVCTVSWGSFSAYSYQTKTMLYLLSASEHCSENQPVRVVFFAREKLFVGAIVVIPYLFLFHLMKKHIVRLV